MGNNVPNRLLHWALWGLWGPAPSGDVGGCMWIRCLTAEVDVIHVQYCGIECHGTFRVLLQGT